jgi:HEAT repeat protein
MVLGIAGCSKSRKPVPDLIKDLKNQDEAVRIQAANALAEDPPLDDEVAPAALAAALTDSSPYVRTGAARALGALGAKAEGAVPALEKAQKDKDGQVAQAATEALEKIKGK